LSCASNEASAEKLKQMKAYLIQTPNKTSEFKFNFEDVQIEMNILEKVGDVSNVIVMKFENNLMVKSFTYDWNGVQWEKRKK
jgi:hypothetical protein